MSLSQVRTYFETVIATAAPTAKRWEGKFDLENIPRNVADQSYSIEFGDLDSGPLDDLRTDDNLDIVIRLFIRGKRDKTAVEDTAYDLAHTIRMEAIKPSNALVGANIKNVILDSISKEDINENDNSLILNLDFSVRLIFAP